MHGDRDSVFYRIGKTLQVQIGDVTREPLPKRWVDLILHLDELERGQRERIQGNEPPAKKPN